MAPSSVKIVDASENSRKPSLPEYSLVRTRVDIVEGDVCVPAGSIGTIVLAHPEKDGFELEFSKPFQAVVGAWRHEVDPVE